MKVNKRLKLAVAASAMSMLMGVTALVNATPAAAVPAHGCLWIPWYANTPSYWYYNPDASVAGRYQPNQLLHGDCVAAYWSSNHYDVRMYYNSTLYVFMRMDSMRYYQQY